MNKIQYVTVIVVDPDGTEYDVEVNPSISDSDLLKELTGNPELGLHEEESNYRIRKVHRTSNGKIRENSVVVIDFAKHGNLGKVNVRG